MSAEFGWNRGTISLAAAIGALVGGVSQPFLGRLYDRLGGRQLILASLVVSGVGTMLLALTTHLLFLILLFGGVLSIAMGGSSLTTTSALLAKWFHRHRTTAVALNASGASVGGLLLVPLTALLIHLVGWRLAWVVLGLLLLLVAVPLAYVLLKDDPAELGLLPDGDHAPRSWRARQPRTAQSAGGRALATVLPFHAHMATLWRVLRMRVHHRPHLDPFHAVRHRARRVTPTAATAMADERLSTWWGAGCGGAGGSRRAQTCSGLVYALRGCAYAALLLAPGAWSLWASS
jgi:MFS family permease